MRGFTPAGVFFAVTLAMCDDSAVLLDDDTHHEKCVVKGPNMEPSTGSASASQLVLPVPGKDVCHALREHCGGGRHGALCVKAALETILPNDRHVAAIRASMRVPTEFYFLCAGSDIPIRPTGSTRVAKLTDMLRRAASHGSLDTRPQTRQGVHHAGADYRQAARWSELASWTAEEKVEHFVDALQILPDNSHCIDRLAVALGEAGEAVLGGSPGPPAKAVRSMLLHYAVLRRIIVHPLQRPLALTPGLTGHPFWDPQSFAPWLESLVRSNLVLQGRCLWYR